MALRFEEVKTLLLTHRLQSPQNCTYSCWQILLHLLFPRNDRQRIRQEKHDPNSSKKKFWKNQRSFGEFKRRKPKSIQISPPEYTLVHFECRWTQLGTVDHQL